MNSHGAGKDTAATAKVDDDNKREGTTDSLTSSLVIVPSQITPEAQFNRDIEMISGAINKPGEDHPLSGKILKKIFALLYFGSLVCYKDGRQWQLWDQPIAAALGHSARILIQFPSELSEEIKTWLFESEDNAERYLRLAATHGIDVDVDESKEPTADQEKLLREKKVSLFSEAVRVARTYAAQIAAYVPVVGAELSGAIGPSDRHYGVNLALGGAGEIHPNSVEIIQNDGRNGHLYMNYRPGEANSAGGLLVGLEHSGPGYSDQYGGGHGPFATHHPVSATGGQDLGKNNELKGLGPSRYYDGLFLNLTKEQWNTIKVRIEELSSEDLIWLKSSGHVLSREQLSEQPSPPRVVMPSPTASSLSSDESKTSGSQATPVSDVTSSPSSRGLQNEPANGDEAGTKEVKIDVSDGLPNLQQQQVVTISIRHKTATITPSLSISKPQTEPEKKPEQAGNQQVLFAQEQPSFPPQTPDRKSDQEEEDKLLESDGEATTNLGLAENDAHKNKTPPAPPSSPNNFNPTPAPLRRVNSAPTGRVAAVVSRAVAEPSTAAVAPHAGVEPSSQPKKTPAWKLVLAGVGILIGLAALATGVGSFAGIAVLAVTLGSEGAGVLLGVGTTAVVACAVYLRKAAGRAQKSKQIVNNDDSNQDPAPVSPPPLQARKRSSSVSGAYRPEPSGNASVVPHSVFPSPRPVPGEDNCPEHKKKQPGHVSKTTRRSKSQ